MLRKTISLLAACVLLLTPAFSASADDPAASTETSGAAAAEPKTPEGTEIAASEAYADYRTRTQASPSGLEEHLYLPEGAEGDSNTGVLGGTGAPDGDSLFLEEEGYLFLDVSGLEGRYSLTLEYDPAPDSTRNIEMTVLLDGELPFREASGLTLTRRWRDKNGVIESDSYGNDIRPSQEEIPFEERGWLTYTASIPGYYTDPIAWELTGVSRLTLHIDREALRVHSVKLEPLEETPDYAAYIAEHDGVPDASVSLPVMEAELPAWKSDATLVASSDRTTPATSPNKGSKISLNMLSGEDWSTVGSEVAWSFTPEESGMYVIRLRCRQNYSQGFYSPRALRIDGEYPFQEAANLRFRYARTWQYITLSQENGEAFRFYFEAGRTYTLSLSVTLGDLAEILSEASGILDELNGVYRELLMIMGSTPDTYRDYKLDELIPDTLTGMGKLAGEIEGISSRIETVAGAAGNDLEILEKLTVQLRSFEQEPEKIPSKLSYFKENIASLTNWIVDASSRPLDIDTITIAAPSEEVPPADAGFWEKLGYHVQLFLASFVEDYNSLSATPSGKNVRTVTVWSAEGRDQATIYNEMIQSSFQPQMERQHGQPVSVKLQLVSSDTILPSLAAGNGPDVLMGVGTAQPVDFALRKVCADLRALAPEEELEEVLARFRESAYAPFELEGGLYALPTQQTFSVLFYRSDILKELGIAAPTLSNPWTWDDVIAALPVLQNNNMSILMETGVNANTSGVPTYAMLLYQNGGEFYTDGYLSSALDADVAVSTFQFWTNLYTSYGLPSIFNIANRFRTGESPIVIADQTLYNTLAVSAPEIKGLWEIAMVPGTVREDGTVDYTTYTSSSGAVVLSAAKDPEMGWEYLKWLTSADTQRMYCQEIESLLGTSARYPSANVEAMNGLGWTKKESQVLTAQAAWARAVPEVPGGYYLARYLNNAFRQVVTNSSVDAKEAILSCSQTIDKEIYQKRSEFGLSVAE